MRAELERERLVLLAEGVPAAISRGDARKVPTLAAVGLSQQRLAIYVAREPLIDVTWDSGDARLLDLTAQDDGLLVGLDAEHFAEDRTGRVELFLRSGDAAKLQAAIEQRRRPLDPRRFRKVDT